MKPIVEITRVETGEKRSYEFDAPWDDGYEYMWSEGNYACDCNRALFFDRAGSEESDESWEAVCGDGKYRVRILESETQKVLYEDG